MASPSSSKTTTNRSLKRHRPNSDANMADAGSSAVAAADSASPSRKKQKTTTVVIPPWDDIPEWKSDRCPLLEMPVEILDKIFSTDSDLQLQDHLALSGTCRSIRKAYTESVWKSLISFSTSYTERAILNRIFSTALLVGAASEGAAIGAASSSSQSQQSPRKGKSKAVMTPKELVVQRVNYSETLSTTEAKARYKLSEKEILTLPFGAKKNPFKRAGAPIRSFKKARVYALAMRVHGGPLGHQAHLAKLAERSAKTKATKIKNGTMPVKKPKPHFADIVFPLWVMMASAVMGDEYDGMDEDYYDYDDY